VREAREHDELEHQALPMYQFLVPICFVITGSQVHWKCRQVRKANPACCPTCDSAALYPCSVTQLSAPARGQEQLGHPVLRRR
jgi:hypothetical protein